MPTRRAALNLAWLSGLLALTLVACLPQAGVPSVPLPVPAIFAPEAYATSTLAGGASEVGFADGQGQEAVFYNPSSLILEPDGNLLVLDRFNHRIRRVTPSGAVSTYWGTGERGNRDGAEGVGRFNQAIAMLREPSGAILIADTQNHSIRRLLPNGELTTVAGNGVAGFVEGPAAESQFNWPGALAQDPAGNIYIADRDNHSIRKLSPTGEVSTLAGNGSPGRDNGLGPAASFNGPMGLTYGPDDLLYVADTGNHLIRTVSLSGEVASFAGTGQAGSREGQREQTEFQGPNALAFDSQGNLFVIDRFNHRIQVITLAGDVVTLAGDGEPVLRDGVGREASFAYPYHLVVSPTGTVYIADYSNHAIRQLQPRQP